MPVSCVMSGTLAGANHSGYQPDHGNERHGVAGAHQHAAEHPAGDVVREGELKLAKAHQDGSAGDHGPRSEAVHEDPYRDLQARVDEELQHGEEGDLRCAWRGTVPSPRGPRRQTRCAG